MAGTEYFGETSINHAIFSFIRHGRWSAGAHDEEKRETSESFYIINVPQENWVQVKKDVLSLHGLHSLQSAWSAFQNDRAILDDLQKVNHFKVS